MQLTLMLNVLSFLWYYFSNTNNWHLRLFIEPCMITIHMFIISLWCYMFIPLWMTSNIPSGSVGCQKSNTNNSRCFELVLLLCLNLSFLCNQVQSMSAQYNKWQNCFCFYTSLIYIYDAFDLETVYKFSFFYFHNFLKALTSNLIARAFNSNYNNNFILWH